MSLRSFFYSLARLLGDLNAIRRGPSAMLRRAARKAAGRVAGRFIGRIR